MVAAIHYFGDTADTNALLAYLGHGALTELRQWWSYAEGESGVVRTSQVAVAGPVAVVSMTLGPTVLIHDADDDALATHDRAGLFNRMNFERRSHHSQPIIDANRSPVIFWQPSTASEDGIQQGSIGSQAESMRSISVDYERWVNRTMSWVRRRGTRVWGLEGSATRPDLEIDVSHISAIYALPGALALLEAGVSGR